MRELSQERIRGSAEKATHFDPDEYVSAVFVGMVFIGVRNAEYFSSICALIRERNSASISTVATFPVRWTAMSSAHFSPFSTRNEARAS